MNFSVDLIPKGYATRGMVIPNYAFLPWKPPAFWDWTLIICIWNCKNIAGKSGGQSAGNTDSHTLGCIRTILSCHTSGMMWSYGTWKYSGWLKGFIVFSKAKTHLSRCRELWATNILIFDWSVDYFCIWMNNSSYLLIWSFGEGVKKTKE